jgi:hypothetical protein
MQVGKVRAARKIAGSGVEPLEALLGVFAYPGGEPLGDHCRQAVGAVAADGDDVAVVQQLVSRCVATMALPSKRSIDASTRIRMPGWLPLDIYSSSDMVHS